jgi:hypothetical protein
MFNDYTGVHCHPGGAYGSRPWYISFPIWIFYL